MLKRRFDGRFPIDPFGFDPQIVDLVAPIFSAAIRVEIEGGENVRSHGSAVLVANRGFGIFEPAVLGIAVRRTSRRAGSASSARPRFPHWAGSRAGSARSARARPTCARA